MHWPLCTSVLSANAPMPSAGDSSVPSVSVIFWDALNVLKQYHGRPRRHDRHEPHTARQLRITKSPGVDVGDAIADRLDDAGRLVPEQEREVVVDPTLAVVEVGVAHPARLDGDDGLTRPGIGDHDRLDADRLALGAGDHSSYFLRHSRRTYPTHPQPPELSASDVATGNLKQTEPGEFRTTAGLRVGGRGARRSRPRPSGSRATRRAPSPGA